MGLHVEQYPKIAKEVADRGYLIGNHSYQHPNFDELDDASIQQEINKTQDLIEAATGVRPNMYRPPYGNGKGKMDRLYPELLPVFWNVDSEDWLSRNSQTVIDHVLATMKPRAIILMRMTSIIQRLMRYALL